MENDVVHSTHARRRCGHGRTVLGLALGLSLVAGLAWAGFRGHGGFGHRGVSMARHSPQLVHDFIEFRVERALREVKATDEQRRQVQSILGRAFEEHAGHRARHAAVHEQALELLSGETIDAARIETLRAEQVERLDEASRKLVATTIEIAQLLTPQQRRQLAELHRGRFE